jgi:hypothetical protein
MQALTLTLDGTHHTARRALGAVSCRIVRSPDGKRLFDKSHLFGEEDIPALLSLRGLELSLLMPEEGDIDESEAAMRLGRALAGPGINLTGPSGARARLVAAHRGLLCVDPQTVARVNSVGSVSVYTLFDGQSVEKGEVVAEAKVTPLLVASSDVDQAESLTFTPPVSVLPFQSLRAAALIRERISPAQSRRMADSLSAKLQWFGSTLGDVHYITPDAPPESIAGEMRRLIEAGAELLLASGGSASDPADPLLNALAHLDTRPERTGIPAHPGSMLWLAYAGEIPIVGVPTCGSFSEATALDLVLPVLLAGQHVTASTLATFGHGGLLTGSHPRFPGYRSQKS